MSVIAEAFFNIGGRDIPPYIDIPLMCIWLGQMMFTIWHLFVKRGLPVCGKTLLCYMTNVMPLAGLALYFVLLRKLDWSKTPGHQKSFLVRITGEKKLWWLFPFAILFVVMLFLVLITFLVNVTRQ